MIYHLLTYLAVKLKNMSVTQTDLKQADALRGSVLLRTEIKPFGPLFPDFAVILDLWCQLLVFSVFTRTYSNGVGFLTPRCTAVEL